MANENLHSNAQNFPSFASGGVDPRTGLYTFTLTLPSTPTSDLSGPDFSLALTFSPIGGDDWAFGAGWSTNLSHVRLQAPRKLKLSTGEQYLIDGSGEEPLITERKLPSFRYLQQGDTTAQIIHRTGAVEHLSYPGVGEYLMPRMLQTPTGQAVHLTYENDQGRPRLATVSDDAGQSLLRLVKESSSLLRIHTPTGEFKLNFADGRLRSLELPEDVGGCWTFEYTGATVPYANITKVTQPLGAIEDITYGQYHLVPANGMPNVPRVTRHTITAGATSAQMVSEYRYGDDNHNFLGFGGLTDWRQDGTDNLYRAVPDYTYSVIQEQKNGDQRRTTTRVYNSFHLMTSETTRQGDCITERQVEYHLKPGAPYQAQPAQFQLPKTTTLKWRIDGQEKFREETTLTEFDVHGNLTRQQSPDGRETTYTYYPAQGEEDEEGIACPADPWGFVRHYRTITERPAGKAGDPWFKDMTITRYRHGRVECVEGTAGTPERLGYAIQAVDIHSQSTRGGQTAHHRQVLKYHHAPTAAGRHQHGRLKSSQSSLWNAATPEACTTSLERYTYERVTPTASRTRGSQLRTTVQFTAHDGCHQQAVRVQDCATGLTVSSQDPENTETTYSYDGLQRLSSARVNDPETPAERIFTYLRNGASGLPEAIQTSAKNVDTRTCYDFLGREVQRHRSEGWRSEPSEREVNSLFWEGRYDAFGRLYQETSYDDCGLEAARIGLTQTYEYDDWGRLKATLLPDGTRSVSETSPFGAAGNVIESWLESVADEDGKRTRQGSTRTELGAHGKPVVTEIRLPDGQVEHRQTYHYDGWGQCIKQTEQFRVDTRLGPVHETLMCYDAWGRLQRTTQPNGDVFLQEFAPHSSQAWVSELKYQVNGENGLECRTHAKRVFDGLGRVTCQSQGGRTLRYQYEGGSDLPSEAHQADGQVIHYSYRPSLTSSPRTAKSGGLNFSYDYDPVTAELVSAEPADAEGQPLRQGPMAIANTYRYSKTGQLLEQTRNDQDQTYITAFQESFAGRRVRRTDSAVGATLFVYDDAGRVREQQSLTPEDGTAETITLGYDNFGRLHTRACGELSTESAFDALGRETERRILRDGSMLCRYEHTYQGNGNLTQRLTFDASGKQILCETYEYDARNRLVQQTNQGEVAALPRDSFGEPMLQQIFDFDTLDNLKTVMAIYASGEVRMTEAEYSAQDSCQLKKLTHSLMATKTKAVKAVEEETFAYDANGRLESRSSGWRLSYDALGRLATLEQPGGCQRRYRYDPQGILCAVDDSHAEHQRFYDGLAIDHVRQGTRAQRYISAAGTPLALLETDSSATTSLVSDRNGTIMGEWRENALHTAIYDAYGASHADTPLTCELGFNGELREGPGSDLYLLGRGYRLYDATLQRFLAPDDASPFGVGGLNPYAYCRGNPVMLYDPTGHMPQWTAANLPYYVAPAEEQDQGGGWFGGLFKTLGWAFIGWEAFSIIKLGIAVVTAATGGLMAIGAAATALGVAALGVGVASMLDEDNEALMYASIGLGVFSGMAMGKAGSMIKVGRAAKVGGPATVPAQEADLLARLDRLRNGSVVSGGADIQNAGVGNLSPRTSVSAAIPTPPPMPLTEPSLQRGVSSLRPTGAPSTSAKTFEVKPNELVEARKALKKAPTNRRASIVSAASDDANAWVAVAGHDPRTWKRGPASHNPSAAMAVADSSTGPVRGIRTPDIV